MTLDVGNSCEPSAALGRVIEIVGSRAKLAAKLGVTRAAVSQWRDVPVGRLSDVVRLTGLSVSDVRPDLFKPPPDPP